MTGEKATHVTSHWCPINDGFSVNWASIRFVCKKIASFKKALVKFALDKLALVKLVPWASIPYRLAEGTLIPVKSMPEKLKWAVFKMVIEFAAAISNYPAVESTDMYTIFISFCCISALFCIKCMPSTINLTIAGSFSNS